MKPRQTDRTFIGEVIEVTDQETGQSLGNLCDLSETGLMLVGDLCPVKEKVYQLEVHLPTKLKHLQFKARCRWIKVGDVEDSYESGFVIEEESSKTAQEFTKMAAAFDFFKDQSDKID